MGLVDVATAKEWLPHLVDATGPHAGNALSDAELQDYIDAATATAERVAGRGLAAEDHVDIYSGSGARELRLENWPVLSVAEIKIDADGDFDAATVEDGATYHVDGASGTLIRRTRWTIGYRNIQVSYRAGYELPTVTGAAYTVPADLERAVIEVIDWMRQRDLNQTIGIRTVIGADGLQTSYSLDVPMSARSVFHSFREARV